MAPRGLERRGVAGKASAVPRSSSQALKIASGRRKTSARRSERSFFPGTAGVPPAHFPASSGSGPGRQSGPADSLSAAPDRLETGDIGYSAWDLAYSAH